jgi:DNA-3-methyladenine glycosylase II
MKKPMDPFSIRKAQRHLKASDQVLAALIEEHGPCTITLALENPFHALTSSIISQQLSAAAARAIKRRLFALLGTEQFFPEGILQFPARSLRAAGLSRAKVEYIRGLAAAVRRGAFDFASIAQLEDEEVVAELVTFPGIGRWTAEMFLLFGLGRPDVWAVNDAGIRKALKLAYHLPQMPSAAEMIAMGEPWRPYRSVASWYLWRVVD